MLRPEGVTHWSIPVRDLESTIEFYRDFLGLEDRGSLGKSRAQCFRAGSADLICWETGKDADRSIVEAGVHYAFIFSPEEWDRAILEVRRLAIPLNRPVIYRETGKFLGRELYVLDPSGNEIELTDPTWRSGMPTPTYEEIIYRATVW